MDPKDLLYTNSHEWIEPSGDVRAVGISEHAQQMLGDIVYVEMPEVGCVVSQGDELLTVESPKAAASVYAPVGGEVVAINENLDASPDMINKSACGEGWLVKLRPTDFESEKAGLLDYDSYKRKIDEE
ncbi:MAG: glycine cleavage system protein [Candidatus Sumerlaeota bacterium]|nr:glycine cleavage system protein [Candidatus Sumerlaeota bacterium]